MTAGPKLSVPVELSTPEQAPAKGGRARASARRAVPWLALVVVGLGLFWASYTPSAGAPYDPNGTGPTGAKGLYLLLGRLGQKVDLAGDLPAAGHGVALVMMDQLGSAGRARLKAWAHSGGTLVVADPASSLAGAAVAQGLPDQAQTAQGPLLNQCGAPWANGARKINPAGGDLLELPVGSQGCFPGGGGDFAVAVATGRGVIVTLGGPGLWSNEFLAQDGDALLAADLLAPVRGGTVTWFAYPEPGGASTHTLWGLMPGRAKAFLIGLVLVGVIACAATARRLGRPVLEPPLVPLPASELVAATGQLLASNRRFGDAAQSLREQTYREVREQLGQPAEAPPATVARAAAHRYGLPADELVEVMAGPPPQGEEDLVKVVAALQRLRKEVAHGSPS